MSKLTQRIIEKEFNGNAEEYRLQMLIQNEIDRAMDVENEDEGILSDSLGHLFKIEYSDVWHCKSIKQINEKDEVIKEISLEDFAEGKY